MCSGGRALTILWKTPSSAKLQPVLLLGALETPDWVTLKNCFSPVKGRTSQNFQAERTPQSESEQLWLPVESWAHSWQLKGIHNRQRAKHSHLQLPRDSHRARIPPLQNKPRHFRGRKEQESSPGALQSNTNNLGLDHKNLGFPLHYSAYFCI